MASIPRVWTDQPLAPGEDIELAPEAARHLIRVLRKNSGDPVLLCNGSGREFEARISAVSRNRVQVTVVSAQAVSRESTLQVHLGQALSQPRRFDLVLQKATELGVSEITPLHCSRCNTRVDRNRVDDRMNHWQGVVTSACEQSGRNLLPALHRPAELADWISARQHPVIYLHPQAGGTLDAMPRPAACSLLIGPEGGFADEELALLADAGHCTGIALGPRILRTETAPLAALAILQYVWGDLSSPG